MEDSKEKTSSQQKSSEEEKKPQPAPAAAVHPAAGVTPTSPRPAPSVQARPAVSTAPPAPAPRPQVRDTGRRNFVKAIAVVSAILSIVPFVPWGDFLSRTAGKVVTSGRQKVVVDQNVKNGSASGKPALVSDQGTFKPDSSWIITYPSSGDPAVDGASIDTLTKWQLIRLPAGQLGGDKNDASAFVAFSKVCVHLWCSPTYNSTDQAYECPCHGSTYEVPDGLAVQGPAAVQAPPTNAIPMLTLTMDSQGYLWIEAPIWDVDHNGLVGYGRYADSYQNYILPVAEGKIAPPS